jgi:hypothetical protein
MYELIEKVENLKQSLDNEEHIKEIKKLNKEILKSEELLNLLNEYKLSSNEDIKKNIMSNTLFKKYKLVETDINIIILEINSRLKEISESKCCK